MGEEIAFENGQISRLSRARDLDLGSGHTDTIMHHLSTSTYIPNFIKIEETFCGRLLTALLTYLQSHVYKN